MPEETESEERQRVLDKLEERINDIHELQRVIEHLSSGGSSEEDWVKEFFAKDHS